MSWDECLFFSFFFFFLFFLFSFQELQKGLDHLKLMNMQLSVGPKALVKNNLETFIECHDTLTDILSW